MRCRRFDLLLDFAPMQASVHDAALAALMISDPQHKCGATLALREDWCAGSLTELQAADILEPLRAPGRPARPELVPPVQLAGRRPGSREGHAALLHAIAHIEFNAINLALDCVHRFRSQPPAFHDDWLKVAAEEAYHFGLVVARLQGSVSTMAISPRTMVCGRWPAALRTTCWRAWRWCRGCSRHAGWMRHRRS